jgi:hypothetical protein
MAEEIKLRNFVLRVTNSCILRKRDDSNAQLASVDQLIRWAIEGPVLLEEAKAWNFYPGSPTYSLLFPLISVLLEHALTPPPVTDGEAKTS